MDANQETTDGVKSMVLLTDSFDLQHYTKYKAKLEKQCGLIFKNCTMTGDAHNQLHNFLLPLRDNFEGLASRNTKEASNAFNNIKIQLKFYNQLFK